MTLSVIDRVQQFLLTAKITIPKTYKGYGIKVVDHTPDATGNAWIGIWDFDKDLNGTIYLERKYVNAIKKNDKLKSNLKETLEHEAREANLAKAKVTKEYGDPLKIPFKKRKKLLDKAGADAHHGVVTAMHPGWTEKHYLAQLDKELAGTGLEG